MAEITNYYNIGQIRWSSEKQYNNDIGMSIKPYSRIDNISNLNYRDIYFDFSSTHQNLNSVYCIHLEIPRNSSYDMIFDLLLVNKDNDNKINLNNYQFVRRVRVPKRNSEKLDTSVIVLYPDQNESSQKVKAGVVRKTVKDPLEENSNLDNGDIIKKIISEENDTFEYYVKTGNGYKKIERYTDAILVHSWNEELTEEKASYDIVFSNKVPTETVFNCLYLKMNRQAYEADIRYTIPKDKDYSDEEAEYYGLFLDEQKMGNCKCKELINWIGEDSSAIINTSGKNLNTIGVWSHPDAIMAINGEEIRVGQSGYYELNDFNIYSFSMLIRDENDRFSVDYQYKKD